MRGGGPKGGHGTAQLSDVASAKKGRVRYVSCVILTCSSAMLYNRSSIECLYLCYQVECLEVSIEEADSPPPAFYACVGQGRLKLYIEADALKDHSGGLLNPSICVCM